MYVYTVQGFYYVEFVYSCILLTVSSNVCLAVSEVRTSLNSF